MVRGLKGLPRLVASDGTRLDRTRLAILNLLFLAIALMLRNAA